MKRFIYPLLSVVLFTGLYSVPQVQAQKVRNRSDISFINLEKLIRNRVKTHMSEWLIRGEFETTEMYNERLGGKEKQVKEFTQEAVDHYMQSHIEKIDFSEYEVSRYDPDRETYRITVHRIGSFILPVPLEEAPDFKDNSDELQFRHPRFNIQNNAWVLESIQVICTGCGKTYTYDSKRDVAYNPNDFFQVEMEDLNIDIPQANGGSTRSVGSDAYYNIDEEFTVVNNLPDTKNDNPDAIAIVIGNKNYQATKRVDYAVNDALQLQKYLINVLGFKKGNVIFLKDLTKGLFDQYFGTANNHRGRLFNLVKEGKSDVFIFYSGHGAPGINDKEGYFVPVECDPNNVELGGYSLKVFYENLAKIPARSKTVVLDACFSGSGIIDNISSPVIRNTSPVKDKNTIVITSSKDSEVSTWYNAKRQGLFTYFFLKAIKDKESSDKNEDNKLTYQEIFDYLSDSSEGVPYYARRLHGIQQTPTIFGENTDLEFVKF